MASKRLNPATRGDAGRARNGLSCWQAEKRSEITLRAVSDQLQILAAAIDPAPLAARAFLAIGEARNIIGVDIGSKGALALISPAGALLEVADMPVLADGPKNRPAVNAPLLAEIIWKWQAGAASIEYVGARPGEGAVGAFAFGRSRGVVEGVLGACGVPAALITPPVWKRAVGIPPGRDGAKDAARSEAIRRWPSHASQFARVRDDGRAESALIAVAGLLRKGGAP